MKRNFFDSFIYNFFIGILALIAILLAIYDLTRGLNSPVLDFIDNTIWGIFIIDYLVRFFIDKDKKAFVKNNVFDFLAIMPFNSIFRAFRLVKFIHLTKLHHVSKLSKFTRLIVFIHRFFNKCKEFFNTNGFKYIASITFFIIFFGAVGMYFIEGLAFKDALWWSFVTTTTVGYGDIYPKTGVGRIIACILMLVGVGLIGFLTSTITAFFFNTKNKAKDFKTIEIESIKEKIDDIDNLSDDDIDNICKVLKALRNKN